MPYSFYRVGDVRPPCDEDFAYFKNLCEENTSWRLEYDKDTKVWTKECDLSDFKMFKVTSFVDSVSRDVMYDVLHDPDYRRKWDKNMHSSADICRIGVNSDINYYAFAAPPPFQNRDVVTQRVWLHTNDYSVIFNHSVFHKLAPPKKNFVRALSYLSGYLVVPKGENSCQFYYITHCDPGGSLPAWAVNMVTQTMAPSTMRRLVKFAQEYPAWKAANNPGWKPWIHPQQLASVLSLDDSDVLNCPDFDMKSTHIDETQALREDYERGTHCGSVNN